MTIRKRRWKRVTGHWAIAAFTRTTAALMISFALVVASLAATHGARLELIPVFLFAGVYVWMAWRFGWLGAYVSEHELLIRNVFRSVRIQRQAIASMGIDTWDIPLGFGQNIGTVFLKDGTKTQITALVVRIPVWQFQLRSVERSLEEMDRWLRESG